MLEFHEVTLEDKSWCDVIFAKENTRSADFNFGNIYMWDERYMQHLSRVNDRIIIQLKYEERPFFAFPVGDGPLEEAINAMKEYAASKGWRLRISGITDKSKKLLESLYPGRFEYRDDVPLYDYIYDIDKLCTYAGKKLHGKKNHCNRFEANYQWSFVQLTPEMIPDCLRMLDDWMSKNAERLESTIRYEYVSIIRGFEAYEQLGLMGGVLLVDGDILGFSVGELISSDTFNIHFEKAYTDINGAYPMVCREMARMVKAAFPEVKYLNREDDMGLESLRKSKLSYRPEYLLKKYTARELRNDG